MKMIISIIAAASDNNVIGNKGKIPWHLPVDFKHFKKITSGHHVVMGQLTHESLGKALPDRVNIVLSKDKVYECNGCVVVDSLEEALDFARKAGESEVFIIGGGSVYKQTIPLASKIYLTRVHVKLSGDTFFPNINKLKWKEVSHEAHRPDKKNPYPFDFCVYERKS